MLPPRVGKTHVASLRSAPWLSLVWLLAGCGAEPAVVEPMEPVAVASAAISVEQAVNAGCSTSQLEALSMQIIEQGNCNEPNAYAALPSKPNVSLGGAVLPYIQKPARDALVSALDANPSTSMQINSMLRTVAQQYLLYRWYQLGICGIGLAASPGNSNHESGLAIDIQQYGAWQTILESNGFNWLGASDPVHFDYVGPGSVNYQGLDVLAFQQLWNINHPEDLIGEDGVYGPQTEGRLKQSPAEGFALGPDCGGGGSGGAGGGPVLPMPGDLVVTASFSDAADDFADGPSAMVVDLFAGESYSLQIDVRNGAEAALPAVAIELALPAELLSGQGFQLARDGGGAFEPMVVPAGNPAADVTLPSAFQLKLGSMEPAETIRIQIPVAAFGYGVLAAESAALEVTADADPQQLLFDVYDTRRYEWDGGRREGWLALPAAEATALASLADKQLQLSSETGELRIERTGLALPVGELVQLTFAGTRSGGDSVAKLRVATDGADVMLEGSEIELDWPADGERHLVTVPESSMALSGQLVTAIALVVFEQQAGSVTAELDYLHIGVTPELRIPGTNADCNCATAQGGHRSIAALWSLGLVLAMGLRRRRWRSRS